MNLGSERQDGRTHVDVMGEGMADVFLSYRNTPERRVFVKRLALILRAHELTVWWDYGLEAGEGYRAQITEELSKARAVAPLWCEESVRSKWVLMEAELGKDKLVPARLQAVAPPEAFEAIQAADLIGWDGAVENSRTLAYVKTICARIGKRGSAPADMMEELRDLRPLTPLPLVSAGAHSLAVPTQASALFDDLRKTWSTIDRGDSSAVEKFLFWVQGAAPGSGLEFEIANTLQRLKTSAAHRDEDALYALAVSAADVLHKSYNEFSHMEPWDAPIGAGDLPSRNRAFREAVDKYLAVIDDPNYANADHETVRRYKLAVKDITRLAARSDLQLFDLAGRVGEGFGQSGAYDDIYFDVIRLVIRDSVRFKELGPCYKFSPA